MGFKEFFGIGGARDKPKDMVGQGTQFFFGRTSAGKVVNEKTAMQITAVYGCVRILSEAIASLPINIYSYEEDGTKSRNFKHPLFQVLHGQPNPEMTSFTFREVMMTHLLLHGNFYSQIIRDGNGRVVSLYPLLPNCMEVERDEEGNLQYIYTRQSDENPNFDEMGRVVLKYEDVLHIPGLAYDGLIGYSPLQCAKSAVGTALAAEEFGASFFKNSATPSGILTHPGILKNPDKVRDSWNSIYQGTSNAHRIAVLEEGMTFSPISLKPEEIQFMEARKFQIEEISRIFRVPLHMLNSLDHATYSNIEHQSIEFVKFSVSPWVVRIEQALEKALLLPSEKGNIGIKMNLEGLMRGDYKSRMEGYQIARNGGWMSTNDIRLLEDLNPISDEEGGNLYLINGAMCKLADAGIFADGKPNEDTEKTNKRRGKNG